MENSSLYKLLFNSYLPVLEESDQQVVWSNNRFEEGTILLYLRGFVLKERHLRSTISAKAAASSLVAVYATLSEYEKIWFRAKKEFQKTGEIKGFLYLTPCLQKVWVSHWAVGYLEEASPSSPS